MKVGVKNNNGCLIVSVALKQDLLLAFGKKFRWIYKAKWID
jgi:hypothetical protein